LRIASPSERLDIESRYYLYGTGNLEKARQVNELRTQMYPREWQPLGDLGDIYATFGHYEEALASNRQAVRLGAPGWFYVRLVYSYLFLNRLEEAQAAAQEARFF